MSNQLDHDELTQLGDRYVALWNEADPANRRKLIQELWTEDGAQVIVDPPQEIRDAAANLAIPAPPLAVHGHDGLDRRAARAYEMFIAPGAHTFELGSPLIALHEGLVGLRWVMVQRSDGAVVAGGYDVLALAADGRIVVDHQYIDGSR